MIKWFKKMINKIKEEIKYRKRLKELKKKDPFISFCGKKLKKRLSVL